MPVSDNEALRFVDNAEIFALSPARVHIINKNCLEKFREPFLSYAYHRLKNQVLVVSKVTEKEIEVRKEKIF